MHKENTDVKLKHYLLEQKSKLNEKRIWTNCSKPDPRPRVYI